MTSSAAAPDPAGGARDVLARRAEAEYPGWQISHGLYGWAGTRTRDGRALESGSLPALAALISVADSDPVPWTSDRAAALQHGPATPDDPPLSPPDP